MVKVLGYIQFDKANKAVRRVFVPSLGYSLMFPLSSDFQYGETVEVTTDEQGVRVERCGDGRTTHTETVTRVLPEEFGVVVNTAARSFPLALFDGPTPAVGQEIDVVFSMGHFVYARPVDFGPTPCVISLSERKNMFTFSVDFSKYPAHAARRALLADEKVVWLKKLLKDRQALIYIEGEDSTIEELLISDDAQDSLSQEVTEMRNEFVAARQAYLDGSLK